MIIIGIAVILVSLVSVIAEIFNIQINDLAWINNWGVTVGWLIRITLLVAGVALTYFLRNFGVG